MSDPLSDIDIPTGQPGNPGRQGGKDMHHGQQASAPLAVGNQDSSVSKSSGGTSAPLAVGNQASSVSKSSGGPIDKKFIIAVVTISLVVAGVFVAFAVAPSQNIRVKKVNIDANASISLSGEEEIRLFLRNYGLKIDENEKRTLELRKDIDALNSRLDKMTSEMSEKIDGAVKAFEEAGRANLQAIQRISIAARAEQRKSDDSGPAQSSNAVNAMRDDILRQLRDAWLKPQENASITHEQAKEQAVRMLRNLGIPEHEIQRLIAQAAEDVGLIIPSDIAEPPPSEHELAAVPKKWFPYLQEARDYLENKAMLEYVVEQNAAKHALKRFLLTRLDGIENVSDEELQAIYNVVRVRRENLTEMMVKDIPRYIRLRENLGIQRNDYKRIAQMLREHPNRDYRLTAGQLLSMVEIIARSLRAGSRERGQPAETFPEIDDAKLATAKTIMRRAVETTWESGRQDEISLLRAATRSLTDYLEVARVSMAEDKKNELVVQIVTDYVQQRIRQQAVQRSETTVDNRHKPSTPGRDRRQMPNVPAPRTVAKQQGDDQPPHISHASLRLTLFHMADHVVETAVPHGDEIEKICAKIVYLTQVDRLAATGAKLLDSRNTLFEQSSVIARQLLPDGVALAKAGASLKHVNIGLRSQRDTPEKAKALYAWLAHRVGQYIHDKDKAEQEIISADSVLRGSSPPDLQRLVTVFSAERK